ncbi:TIGR01777 family oxidoreductase [soil metagenome]
MRILVAGASGLIGSALVERLTARGDEVTRLVRREVRSPDEVRWDAMSLDPSVVDDVDAVVNLSGASVGRIPWTPSYRRVLLQSRVHPTVALAEAIVASTRPPGVYVSGSAVGIYGDRPGELLDESAATGEGFFPDLVRAWEAASAIAAGATRVANPRTAVVISHDGGAMTPIRLLTSFGLGAGFGRGAQFWPWISLHDEVSALLHLVFSQLEGPVNLAAPTPATSDEVTEAFAHVMHRPHVLRVPSVAVKVLGEAGSRLLLDDLNVVPAKLMADGFVWTYPTIVDAVRAIAKP